MHLDGLSQVLVTSPHATQNASGSTTDGTCSIARSCTVKAATRPLLSDIVDIAAGKFLVCEVSFGVRGQYSTHVPRCLFATRGENKRRGMYDYLCAFFRFPIPQTNPTGVPFRASLQHADTFSSSARAPVGGWWPTYQEVGSTFFAWGSSSCTHVWFVACIPAIRVDGGRLARDGGRCARGADRMGWLDQGN